MKKFLVLLLMLATVQLSAQVKVIKSSQNNSERLASPLRNLVDQGVNGIEVNYHFSQVLSVEVNNKAKKYQRLSIPDFTHLQEVGLPALPSHIDLIAIPDGADYSLKIVDDMPNVVETNRVFPALQPARDTEGAAEPSFEINAEFYNTDQIYPQQTVEIIGTMLFRGIRFAMVQVCPVQYNPHSEKLYIHQNVQYEMQFSGANRFTDYREHTQSYMDNIVRYPLNSASLAKEAKEYYLANQSVVSNSAGKNYIILTHSDFIAAADSMANWKRQMGYTVEVVSASSWTASSVTNAVHTRYDNWTPKPDYLLIIGDHQDVPAEIHYSNSSNEAFGTDLYYVCMDGGNDFVPDMAKGRISPSSVSDAMMQVMKTIDYERNPIDDTSFYANALNCAQFQDDDNDGFADRRFAHTSEDIRDYLLGRGYQSERVYYADNNVTPLYYNNGYYSNGQSIPSVLNKLNGYAWNGGANDIKNSINTGKFLVFHRDHGFAGGSGWAHPYFVSNNVNQLTNGRKLPVIFSINCHTGEFTLNQCFAESFMRNANGGAVGVVAASYYSYSGNNDGFSAGMIDGIWSNPGLVPTFGSGGANSPTVNAHTDIRKMGDLVTHGLVRMVQTWGGGTNSNRYSYELFHYFGDPAMKIWTEAPQPIIASAPDTISCLDTAIVISNFNGIDGVATIMGNGVLLGRTNLVGGAGTITLSSIQGPYLTLTISSTDKKPLIKNIAIAGGSPMTLFTNVEGNVCYGDTLGVAEVFPACGTAPYTIIWSTGDTVAKLENMPSGTYTVQVTDATNFSLVDTLVIDGPASPIVITELIQHTKCYYENSGSISLQVSGGIPPYNYLWNTGRTNSQLSNIGAGTYQLSLRDEIGCQTTKSFVIQQPLPLDMQTTFADDTFNNCTGSATSIATGGTLPYSYLWNDASQQTTSIATNLCKGLYRVTLTDSNQCTIYQTVFIGNTLGITTSTQKDLFSLYPNPSRDGMFDLEIKSNETGLNQIVIYNSLGEQIYHRSTQGFIGEKQTINLSNFAKGVYYLQLFSSDSLLGNYTLIYE